MNKIIIPESGNKISEKDIRKNQIRITKSYMNFFPFEDTSIEIIIDNTSFDCKLDLNNKDGKQRSYRIVLGKVAMDMLDVKEGNQIQITKFDDKKYELTKVKEDVSKKKAQDEFMEKFFQN